MSHSSVEIKNIQHIADKGYCAGQERCLACPVDTTNHRAGSCPQLRGIHTNDLQQGSQLAREKAKDILKEILFNEKKPGSWLYRVTAEYGYHILGLDVEDNTYYGDITLDEEFTKEIEKGKTFDQEALLIFDLSGYASIQLSISDDSGAYGLEKQYPSQEEAKKECLHFNPACITSSIYSLGWKYIQY